MVYNTKSSTIEYQSHRLSPNLNVYTLLPQRPDQQRGGSGFSGEPCVHRWLWEIPWRFPMAGVPRLDNVFT